MMGTPRVFISKCITFAPVRYNGQIISDEFVEKLKRFIEPVIHCPEVEIGLSVPRDPLRLVIFNKKSKDVHMMQSVTQIDFTDKIQQYSEILLSNLSNIDGFILKSRSPSCGIRDVKIYSANLKGSSILKKGAGIFGGEIIKRFADKVIIEDEGRLNDEIIRDNFLKCIFLSAEFREINKSRKISRLIQYHEKNKLLILSYNQKILKEMGRIVAESKKTGINKAFELYENCLNKIMTSPYKISNLINSFEHAFGFFKNDLFAEEKKYFIKNLKKLYNNKMGIKVVISLLRSYIIRFNKKYLSNQTLFNPYPEELLS